MIGRLVAWLLGRRRRRIGTFVYCGLCRRVVVYRASTWLPTMSAFVCDACMGWPER